MSTSDRPVLGILLMLGFAITAPVMDAAAKLAAPMMPVGQIVAARFGFQVVCLVPLAMALGVFSWPGRAEALLHLLRAGLLLVATSAFFLALGTLPLADALAIFFVEPFILTLMGALFLGEAVGWRRLLACTVGFGGALLIIRPGFASFGPVALLPLLTAFCFSIYMILTRQVAQRLHTIALQAHTALAALVLIAPALALGFTADIALLSPVGVDGTGLWLMATVGLAATISHLFLSAALRFTPAATIAPLQYFEMVAATILGYLVFSDLPSLQSGVGIALIMGAGIYVFLRERRMARRPLPPV